MNYLRKPELLQENSNSTALYGSYEREIHTISDKIYAQNNNSFDISPLMKYNKGGEVYILPLAEENNNDKKRNMSAAAYPIVPKGGDVNTQGDEIGTGDGSANTLEGRLGGSLGYGNGRSNCCTGTLGNNEYLLNYLNAYMCKNIKSKSYEDRPLVSTPTRRSSIYKIIPNESEHNMGEDLNNFLNNLIHSPIMASNNTSSSSPAISNNPLFEHGASSNLRRGRHTNGDVHTENERNLKNIVDVKSVKSVHRVNRVGSVHSAKSVSNASDTSEANRSNRANQANIAKTENHRNDKKSFIRKVKKNASFAHDANDNVRYDACAVLEDGACHLYKNSYFYNNRVDIDDYTMRNALCKNMTNGGTQVPSKVTYSNGTPEGINRGSGRDHTRRVDALNCPSGDVDAVLRFSESASYNCDKKSNMAEGEVSNSSLDVHSSEFSRVQEKENYKSFLNVINKRMEHFSRERNLVHVENLYKPNPPNGHAYGVSNMCKVQRHHEFKDHHGGGVHLQEKDIEHMKSTFDDSCEREIQFFGNKDRINEIYDKCGIRRPEMEISTVCDIGDSRMHTNSRVNPGSYILTNTYSENDRMNTRKGGSTCGNLYGNIPTNSNSNRADCTIGERCNGGGGESEYCLGNNQARDWGHPDPSHSNLHLIEEGLKREKSESESGNEIQCSNRVFEKRGIECGIESCIESGVESGIDRGTERGIDIRFVVNDVVRSDRLRVSQTNTYSERSELHSNEKGNNAMTNEDYFVCPNGKEKDIEGGIIIQEDTLCESSERFFPPNSNSNGFKNSVAAIPGDIHNHSVDEDRESVCVDSRKGDRNHEYAQNSNSGILFNIPSDMSIHRSDINTNNIPIRSTYCAPPPPHCHRKGNEDVLGMAKNYSTSGSFHSLITNGKSERQNVILSHQTGCFVDKETGTEEKDCHRVRSAQDDKYELHMSSLEDGIGHFSNGMRYEMGRNDRSTCEGELFPYCGDAQNRSPNESVNDILARNNLAVDTLADGTLVSGIFTGGNISDGKFFANTAHDESSPRAIFPLPMRDVSVSASQNGSMTNQHFGDRVVGVKSSFGLEGSKGRSIILDRKKKDENSASEIVSTENSYVNKKTDTFFSPRRDITSDLIMCDIKIFDGENANVKKENKGNDLNCKLGEAVVNKSKGVIVNDIEKNHERHILPHHGGNAVQSNGGEHTFRDSFTHREKFAPTNNPIDGSIINHNSNIVNTIDILRCVSNLSDIRDMENMRNHDSGNLNSNRRISVISGVNAVDNCIIGGGHTPLPMKSNQPFRNSVIPIQAFKNGNNNIPSVVNNPSKLTINNQHMNVNKSINSKMIYVHNSMGDYQHIVGTTDNKNNVDLVHTPDGRNYISCIANGANIVNQKDTPQVGNTRGGIGTGGRIIGNHLFLNNNAVNGKLGMSNAPNAHSMNCAEALELNGQGGNKNWRISSKFCNGVNFYAGERNNSNYAADGGENSNVLRIREAMRQRNVVQGGAVGRGTPISPITVDSNLNNILLSKNFNTFLNSGCRPFVQNSLNNTNVRKIEKISHPHNGVNNETGGCFGEGFHVVEGKGKNFNETVSTCCKENSNDLSKMSDHFGPPSGGSNVVCNAVRNRRDAHFPQMLYNNMSATNQRMTKGGGGVGMADAHFVISPTGDASVANVHSGANPAVAASVAHVGKRMEGSEHVGAVSNGGQGYNTYCSGNIVCESKLAMMCDVGSNKAQAPMQGRHFAWSAERMTHKGENPLHAARARGEEKELHSVGGIGGIGGVGGVGGVGGFGSIGSGQAQNPRFLHSAFSFGNGRVTNGGRIIDSFERGATGGGHFSGPQYIGNIIPPQGNGSVQIMKRRSPGGVNPLNMYCNVGIINNSPMHISNVTREQKCDSSSSSCLVIKKNEDDDNGFRVTRSQFLSLENDIKYLLSLTAYNIQWKDLYFETFEEPESILPHDVSGVGGVGSVSSAGSAGSVGGMKYRVIEEGSFGVVYKGWYRGMQVAVKIPVEKMAKQDPYGLTKRSINEWKILAKCDHPNIIKFCGGIINSYFDIWLVTKLVNGSDLHTIKNSMTKEDKVISIDVSLKMCRQLANVINFLHTPIKDKKKVIIHRDIKPENLIIDNEWNIHLCDFGDSEECEDGIVTNVSGATWIYAPPELLTCHPLKQSNNYNFLEHTKLSYKWDIWSMGCVFQEMMNLPSPFQHYIITFDQSDKIYEKLVDVFTKRLPPCIHSKIENSPFADIIRLCLNYDPNLRPTASEIVKLLSQPDEYLLLKRK
ncbi:protein kinase, putative [Plasmodium ovale]|uniref:Protein kinase, putative n=1 Tax=Plasmodium ovale TaxID=36330 RepID=A0A1D3U818_PLAOA|nr:protein kinase, putative [Plasmodium ovale]